VIAVLALALGTLAAPVFAGAGFGGNYGELQTFLREAQAQGGPSCAYIVDPTTQHSFLGFVTGNGDIKVVGPLQGTDGIPAVLPSALSAHCQQIPPV